ncbi:MAG: hypothetical protein AB1505_10505 [Candidatus Latescibacterota bacterium]
MSAAVCLAWAPLRAQEGQDTPEQPRLGPQRLLAEQPFLGRFEREAYLNYGEEDYPRRLGITSSLRNYYSILGDPLVYGSESVRWVERRGLGVQRYSGSELQERLQHGQSGASFASLFNYVIVGSDGTDAWQSRIIYADELRSRLTPLTFKMANMNGLRVDVGTQSDAFTAFFSRLHSPIYSSGFEGDNVVKAKALLFGTHYERRLGFLNLGTTFVNAHQYEPLMGEKALSWKGVPGAIQNAPALIAIRISDDSPWDGDGPVLHAVQVYVNGALRPELEPFIVRLHHAGDARQSYVAGLLSSGGRKPLPPLANDYQAINRGSAYNTYDPYINYAAFDVDVYYRGYEFPFWIDHLFYRDYKLYGADHVINAGHPETEKDITVHQEFADELVEASGDFGFATLADLPQAFDREEYGILYVDLGPLQEEIQSVSVDLTLANDYRVEESEIDMAGVSPNPPNANYRDRYRYASFFRTAARAAGNPKDGTPRRVRVHAGTPTGLNLYSANVEGVFRGFRINGEVSRSSSFHQYASGLPGPRVSREALSVNAFNREVLKGERHTVTDQAYYLAVERDFRRFAVGSEYFSMGPLYTTEFRSYIGRDELDLAGNPVAYNNTMIHRLVEDNDDNDRYPDSWYNNTPNSQQGQSDIDGIFPGLDEDNDGIPDTNRNYNAQPDYLEPFLMYTSDPQLYDFGVDANHNDFIDARENDTEADLPYDPDLRGLHLYGALKLHEGLSLTLGRLDARQNAGAAPSDATYGRLRYARHAPTLGDFRAELALERVRDGVADPLSVYSDRVLTLAEQFELEFAGLQRNVRIAPFLEEPRPDPLLFKNSLWRRLFIDARWRALPNLSMHNKVRFEVNGQQEGVLYDGSFQEGDHLTRWTMVHSLDHDWRLSSRLGLFSGLKFRYRREWQDHLALPTAHERHLIPLVKLDYRLTERTRFQVGFQGIGSLVPYRVTDLVHPESNFEQSDAVLMMSNDSRYFGYIVSTSAGISRRAKEFERSPQGQTRGERFVSAFMNVIIGYEGE